jgi:sugar (pentulose or hexulose) kinase
MYLLGYVCGTSSIKATLLEAETGKVVAAAAYPPKEMPIISHKPGWAEQNPDDWWTNLKAATSDILQKSRVNPTDIIPIVLNSCALCHSSGQAVSQSHYSPNIFWLLRQNYKFFRQWSTVNIFAQVFVKKSTLSS